MLTHCAGTSGSLHQVRSTMISKTTRESRCQRKVLNTGPTLDADVTRAAKTSAKSVKSNHIIRAKLASRLVPTIADSVSQK